MAVKSVTICFESVTDFTLVSHALRSRSTPVPKFRVNVVCNGLLGFIQYINFGLEIIQPRLN